MPCTVAGLREPRLWPQASENVMQFAIHVPATPPPIAPTPEWYQVYFSAVLETDEGKALIEMVRASEAMEDRLRQLSSSATGNAEEIQDLNSALTYLRLLLQTMKSESEMLSWH